MELYQPLAQLRGLALTLSGPDSMPALVDPLLLALAIGNLIDNALKFASTHVHVRLSGADGTIEVTVTDDRPGVPDSEKYQGD